jgi:ankyrin repeat protein
MAGEKNTAHPFYNPTFKHENIFHLLVKAGADVNVVYPENHYKPSLKDEDLMEEHLGEYDPKGQYYCTPLINLLRLNPQNETMRNNMIGLLEFGAKLDIVDSDGRDPIMHAIVKNNVMALRMMLENQR